MVRPSFNIYVKFRFNHVSSIRGSARSHQKGSIWETSAVTQQDKSLLVMPIVPYHRAALRPTTLLLSQLPANVLGQPVEEGLGHPRGRPGWHSGLLASA